MLNHNDKWSEAKEKLLSFKNMNTKMYVSFSGGKDSTLLLTLLEECNLKNKIDIVFFNTGMEYDATLNFVKQKENEGWSILYTQPQKRATEVWKQDGLPFLSKLGSEMLNRLQKHNFDWKRTFDNYNDLIKDYPNAKGAIAWLTGNNRVTLKAPKYLKNYLVENGLNFKVSNKCCEYLKKKPAKEYEKANNKSIAITGIRESEGGIRSSQYKGCFAKSGNTQLFMPFFWMTDEDMDLLIKEKDVALSDCYTKYGLKRTGCIACPFGKNFMEEREILKKFEPNKSKAIEMLLAPSFKIQEKIKK